MVIGGHKSWGSYGDIFPFGGEGPREGFRGPRRRESLEDGDDCPICGGVMVVRRNRTTGTQFLGCSDFKNGCRFSSDFD